MAATFAVKLNKDLRTTSPHVSGYKLVSSINGIFPGKNWQTEKEIHNHQKPNDSFVQADRRYCAGGVLNVPLKFQAQHTTEDRISYLVDLYPAPN